MPKVKKMYGPYTAKDGRLRVLWYYTDGTRRTESYPRVLMSKKLGRKLKKSEVVDHINNDPTDNRLSNLQILTYAENNSKSAKENGKGAMYLFKCPQCGVQAQRRWSQVKHNRKLGKSGPYCSKSCAGKGSHVNHYAL